MLQKQLPYVTEPLEEFFTALLNVGKYSDPQSAYIFLKETSRNPSVFWSLLLFSLGFANLKFQDEFFGTNIVYIGYLVLSHL